ncbi:hypothetical protein [Falsigemmobacter faecalis]|nr:hypothetical protein [Falsigemmobacter faecalis]
MSDIALASLLGRTGVTTQTINLFFCAEVFLKLCVTETAAMAVLVMPGNIMLTGVFPHGLTKLGELS